MNRPVKKGRARKQARRLNRLLNSEQVEVPMTAHGFGAQTIGEALVLPLYTDYEAAFLGLWSRLGEHFDRQWEAGAQEAQVVQGQDPRGRGVLMRREDAKYYRAIYDGNCKRTLQKHKIDLDHGAQLIEHIERFLKQGPQTRDALKVEVAPFDMDSIEPDVARKGDDAVFDVVMRALLVSNRLVREPSSSSWSFHEWKFSWVASQVEREEALEMVAPRYCEAFPFAQLEDFAWWTKLAPSKVKRAFIEAKTQWRHAVRETEEPLGLYFLPYRDALAEGSRFYEKAWGLHVDPHPRAPGALPLVLLDGQVVGHWTTQSAALMLSDELEAVCQEEEATLFRCRQELSDFMLLRFTDLLPVYDVYE